MNLLVSCDVKGLEWTELAERINCYRMFYVMVNGPLAKHYFCSVMEYFPNQFAINWSRIDRLKEVVLKGNIKMQLNERFAPIQLV